jgi:hypothetical protein
VRFLKYLLSLFIKGIKNPTLVYFFFVKRIIRFFCKYFDIHPTSEPFISGDTFKNLATYYYNGKKIKINKPEIIFTNTFFLKKFSKKINYIDYPFILITHLSDVLVDDEFLPIIKNSKLVHWYAQNCIISHKKISNIPIGLEDRWRHDNGVVSDFKKLRKIKNKKIPRVLCSFNIISNVSARKEAYNTLKELNITDFFRGYAPVYRKKLNNYMFVACPEGNGVDSHRVWEALYLGVMPITINKNFYSNFKNIPMLFLNKWKDLENYSENDLKNIYQKNLHKFKSSKYIWIDFWKKDIKKKYDKLNKI